jgi:iron complex outermembrane recepter protein
MIAALYCGVAMPVYAQTGAGQADAASPAQPNRAEVTASAESADNGDAGDIVVTALKGHSTAQRAPTTVQVVSGVILQKQAVVAVESLESVVPGLRIQQAPGGTINPVVRGIGTSPSSPSFEQSIGLFVDGVYAGHSREYSSALFDIERVELLKGTQASVVGKNTSLGALTLVTRKPNLDELGYEISYGHEFELGGDNVTAAINVPLSSTVAIRIAALYDNAGGYIYDPLYQPDREQGSTQRRAIRATLRWQPNEKFDWTVSGQLSKYSQYGGYFYIGADTLGSAKNYAASIGDPGYVVAPYMTRVTPRTGTSWDGFEIPGSRNEGGKFNSTMTYDLGSSTITAVTGYDQYSDHFLVDGGGFTGVPLASSGKEPDKTFSQEVRIGSNGNTPFSYIFGTYFYYDNWQYNTDSDWNAATLPPPHLGGRVLTNYTQKTETLSFFGNLGYKFGDKFGVTGSARYENFHKSADYSRDVLVPGGLELLYPPFEPTSYSDTKGYFDYSAQAQYFLSSNKMLYASYATGTKGFGYHNGPRIPSEGPYKTETSATFEAGAKLGLGGGSHLNLAYFHTLIDDYQVGVNLGTSFLIRNDNVKTEGAEGDLVLQLTPEFSLQGTVTYADVKKRGTLPVNSIPGLPFAPKWSGIAGANYDMPIAPQLDLNLNASVEFRSAEQLSDTLGLNAIIPESPGYAKLDLRAGVEDRKTGMGMALLMHNVTNTHVINYAYSATFLPGAATIAEDPPRTIMLQFTLKR